jgi:mycoredoxin
MTDSPTLPGTPAILRFTLYTTAWCHHCVMAKEWLKKHGLEPGRDFTEINIEEDPDAAAMVEKLNDGYRSVPTFLMPNGESFHEPTIAELEQRFSSSVQK